MKKIFISCIFFIFIFSCASEQTVYKPAPRLDTDPLVNFFDERNSDLKKAGTVVYDRSILRNLSHLQDMNMGGERYYILEREAITTLIKSVTEDVYNDFIIINDKGRIIYTMSNNEIFGKNVRSHLKNTPYAECFDNIDKDIHIEDVSRYSPVEVDYSIFVSGRVEGKGGLTGVIIFKIGIDEIKKVLPGSASVINADGNYKINSDEKKINKPFVYFDLIKGREHGESGGFSSPSARRYWYRYFSYENIFWILISL